MGIFKKRKDEKLNMLSTRINLCVWADCGPSAALVYGYIRGWILYNAKRGLHSHKHHDWMYQTQREICDSLCNVISVRSVENAINALVKEGYLIRDHLNPDLGDRTSWYALGRDPDIPHMRTPRPKSYDIAARFWKARIRKERARRDQRAKYIDEILNADYTNTWADKELIAEYNRVYCFTELNEYEQYAVASEYVDYMMCSDRTPTPKHFASEDMQGIYALRHGV